MKERKREGERERVKGRERGGRRGEKQRQYAEGIHLMLHKITITRWYVYISSFFIVFFLSVVLV